MQLGLEDRIHSNSLKCVNMLFTLDCSWRSHSLKHFICNNCSFQVIRVRLTYHYIIVVKLHPILLYALLCITCLFAKVIQNKVTTGPFNSIIQYVLVVIAHHACGGACNSSNPPIIVKYSHQCFYGVRLYLKSMRSA